MAKGARVTLDATPLRRAAQQVAGISRRAEQIQSRARATLVRRLRAEAARQISELQLNLRPRQISRHIGVRQGRAGGMDHISVTASATRLPLQAFRPRAIRRAGFVVQTWRDAPPIRLPHAWRRTRTEIWQRIPSPYPGDVGPSGLVHRLPIVQRKGPSLKRTLQPHGKSPNEHRRQEVVERLCDFAQHTLADEIQRLLRSA